MELKALELLFFIRSTGGERKGSKGDESGREWMGGERSRVERVKAVESVDL